MKSSSTHKLLFVFFSLFQTLALAQSPPPPACGANDSLLAKSLEKYALKHDLTQARLSAGEKLEYRLALDINYQTYLLYGRDKDKIRAEAYRFIQEASDIFEREVNIKLTVSFIHIWEQPEPYELVQDVDYFNNVNNYWQANRFEERDAVVSLSCRDGWFYGGYRMCSSNFQRPNGNRVEVDLLCHELGHTLGSPHTHNCSWPGGPIDRCTNVENTNSECLDGYTQGINGSLMSYCRSTLSFHPLCRNLMRDYSEGKLFQSFKLGAYSGNPTSAGVLQLLAANPGSVKNTPAFEWTASQRADRYRFQIARDEAFTNLAEDTVAMQSYFQSAGLADGNYFARTRPENLHGAGNWSPLVPFTVMPFSADSDPPRFLALSATNLGVLTGIFRKYAGAGEYEVEVTEIGEQRRFVHQFSMTAASTQGFRFPEELVWPKAYLVRMRVNKNGIWSKWSEPQGPQQSWNHSFWPQNRLQATSSKPMLAAVTNPAFLTINGYTGYLQISEHADFRSISFRDSVLANAMGSPYTGKMLFKPVLGENKSYYVRSRVEWAPKKYSEWIVSQLSTAYLDQRFTFLGVPSPSLQNIHYANTLTVKNKLSKSNGVLYVHDVFTGYFETVDLQKWTESTPYTTNGKSPGNLNYFGVGVYNEVYTMDQFNRLVKRNGSFYESSISPEAFYMDSYSTIATTSSKGIFFKTANKGVGSYHNGAWRFWGAETLMSNRSVMVAADADEQVWAIMEGGRVWKFAGNQWTEQASTPYWNVLSGMSFDQDKNCYIYGEWGISKLNATARTWEPIEALASYPIRKIVFDEKGQMWAAAFQTNGFDFTYQGLIKYANGKAYVYSDGLNIFYEPFDLEYFQNKLYILTSGGELHTFDEEQIQRFSAKSSYCIGNDVAITITSNSSFGKDNVAKIAFNPIGNGDVVEVPVTLENHLIQTKIPQNLPAGRYSLRTVMTNPPISSNASSDFEVYHPADVAVSAEGDGRFKTTLKVTESAGQTYQWQRDGVVIGNATTPTYVADQSGNYSVTVTNAGGCVSKSKDIAVALDQPSEVTLLQNTPNPVGTESDIAFFLPQSGDVELTLYNAKGQKIGDLKKGPFAAGWHLASIDGSSLASGIYVYRLKAGGVVRSLKLSR